MKTVHKCMGSRKRSSQKSTPDKAVLIARGRLKEARAEFARRGWDTLPQGRRGQKILAWCACMAWNGYPSDPEAAVRRICGGLAPYLKEHELDALIDSTRVTNRRFSHDQSAMVLEIPVTDCLARGRRFLGADDDPDYAVRDQAKRARNAAYQRRRRAAKSSGRPRGRPKSDVPAWVAAGATSERSYYRHKARGTVSAKSGSKNAAARIKRARAIPTRSSSMSAASLRLRRLAQS
jgi:hypothetical protein